MKILSVLAGAVLTVVLYFGLLCLWFFYGNESSSQSYSYEVGWFIGLVTVIPVLIFLGSMLTGYISYYEVENKWKLLWMAPALYFNLLFMSVAGVVFLLDWFIGVNEPRNTDFLFGLLIPFLIGLYWYLASLAGVGLGYFLRGRFARWWYGD